MGIKKKKTTVCCLIIAWVFLINVAAIPIANPTPGKNEDVETIKITNESPMPLIHSKTATNTINTLSSSERYQWVNEVIDIQERVYKQKVIQVEENEEYICFVFDSKEAMRTNQIVEADEMEYSVIIEKIEYLKPEAQIQMMSAQAASTPTKIITYYGWSNGYIKYASKSGQYSVIKDVLMSFVPTVSKPVNWIISKACNGVFDAITGTNTVTAETYNQYYYRNKAGTVYKNGYWYPTAYVGERRSFGWCWSTVILPSGMSKDFQQSDPTEPNSESNPTNYDAREKKPNYDDDAWIMQKAISTYGVGGYWNAYGQALIEY